MFTTKTTSSWRPDVDVWPYIAYAVDQHGSRDARRQSAAGLAAGIVRYKEAREKLGTWLPDSDLVELHRWKMSGFYIDLSGAKFELPTEKISRSQSLEVVEVSQALVHTTAEFVLPHLPAYSAWADSFRRGLTEEGLRLLREFAGSSEADTGEGRSGS